MLQKWMVVRILPHEKWEEPPNWKHDISYWSVSRYKYEWNIYTIIWTYQYDDPITPVKLDNINYRDWHPSQLEVVDNKLSSVFKFLKPKDDV